MAIEDLIYPLLNAYYVSPQWVKGSLGQAYSLVPPAWLRGRHYPRFTNEAAMRDGGQVAELARRKLARTLRCALETVPAYRPFRQLVAGLDRPYEVLRALPVISKDDVRANVQGFTSQTALASQKLKIATGGSTALPMHFYLHKGISRPKEAAFIDEFQRGLGWSRQDTVLALRGRAIPSAGKRGGRLWMHEPIKKELILSSDHLAPIHMPDYIDAMRRSKPVFIQAFASAIEPLARWLRAHPAPDVTTRIKGIALFSEMIHDDQMRLLREVFHCPVVKHYGHSERLLMASSTADDERYCFWPLYGHVELVDDAGKEITVPGVRGEIVGTGFDNLVMPFIRYRTGDLAVLGEAPNPLFPGHPVLERIEGRRQEFLVCRDGRLISVNALTTSRYQDLQGVEQIQFEQHVPGHFLIRVASALPLPDSARQRIVRELEARTQGGCSVTFLAVESIARTPRGKQRMLIQHLDLDLPSGRNGGETPAHDCQPAASPVPAAGVSARPGVDTQGEP